MSASSSSQSRHPLKGVDPLAPASLEHELASALAPLAVHGFPISRWTSATILFLPLPVKAFINKVRIISSIADEKQRSTYVSLGTSHNFYLEACSCSIRGFIDFCDWLRTPAGTAAVRDRQRRTAPGSTVAQQALLAAFDVMRGDHLREVKETRLDYDNRIIDLTRQIKALREEKERRLRAIDLKFAPVTSVPVLNEIEYINRCVSAYLRDCAARNIPAEERNDTMLKRVQDIYGHAVQTAHTSDFISLEPHRARIHAYIRKKIDFLTATAELKQADTFRHLLATAGGPETAEVSSEDQDGDDEEGARGPVGEKPGPEDVHSSLPHPSPPRTQRKKSRSDQVEGTAQTGVRTTRAAARGRGNVDKDKGVGGRGAGRRGKNPPRPQ